MSFKKSHEELNIQLTNVCEGLIKAIVSSPDLVSVTIEQPKNSMTISVSQRDRGVVIGRGGQNLRAIEDSLRLAIRYLLADAKKNTSAHSASFELPSLNVRVSNQEQND